MMKAARSMCGCTTPSPARLPIERTQRALCGDRDAAHHDDAGLVLGGARRRQGRSCAPSEGRAGSSPACCPCRRSAASGSPLDQSSLDVIGVDVNPLAVAAAAANSERNGVADRVRFSQSDLFEGVDGKFDLIVFDPPFRWFRPRDLLERVFADENYETLTRFVARPPTVSAARARCSSSSPRAAMWRTWMASSRTRVW